MKNILARAKNVSRNLPKEVGRGGIIGAEALKSLDASIREVLEARIHAPQSLGEEVDDIVSTRFLAHKRKTQIDQLYSSDNGSNDTGLNVRLHGNMSLYISGSLIMLLKDHI